MNTISILRTSIIAFVSVLVLCVHTVKCDEENIEFTKLLKKLPVALSDMTATYVSDFKDEGSEAIILTGGCSDENGNEESSDGNYYCNTISKEVYVFYPSTQNIVKLADMPFEMYRHTAVFVDGKLYVIGGRTFNLDESNFDELIKEINVYDPKDGDKGTWTNFMSSSDAYAPYATSDQASFVKDKSIYILGGYFSDYETSDDVIALNIETKEIVPLDSMKKKRGDAQAAYYNQGGIEAIYMMGGFTSETSTAFCEPLFDAEKYDFATNTWSDINPLVNQRGDKGVVVLNEKILAIGGETKHESLCGEGLVEPSSQAIVVDDVESYNPLDGDDAEWKIESDFIQFRFRSAVAVAEKLDTVYVFGGQLAYNADCKCYKTSNDIFSYREKHDHDPNSASGKKIAFALTVFVVLASTFLVV